MLSPELFIGLIFLAIGIGILASLFGIGGGFLLVPTMILIVGLETHITVGTASFIITFMSLSSSIAYIRQKRIDFLIVAILSTTNIIGSIIGAFATNFVTGQTILVLFGLVEAILATILGLKKTPQEKKAEKDSNRDVSENITENKDENKKIVKNPWYIIERKKIDRDGIEHHYFANILYALPTTFIAGFLSSLLGIGGGTLYIQIFVFLCGMSIHMSIASSIFMIFFSAIFSTFTFAGLNQINYPTGIALSIGMIIGAQLGAMISRKIDAKKLKKYAAIMIVIIAVRMIIFALFDVSYE